MELRNYQKECLEKIRESEPGSYLINMATGLGKCFSFNTKILMYNGEIKKVQDIKVNDILMGWDNNPRTVKSLSRGIEQMYEIKQNKKESYTVNESHILSLKCTGISNDRIKYIYDINDNKYTNGDICNISVKDYLRCTKTFKHCMKGFSSVIEFKNKNLPIDPYFIGLWLGDGSSNSMSITTADNEIENYLYDFANNYQLDIRKETLNNNNANTYHLHSNYKRTKIRKYFRENLFNNKHIPNIYKINSKKNLLLILAGMLDSDGYLHKQDKSTFEFCSKSINLVNDLAFICRSLGLSCRQFKRYNKKYSKYYYYICIFGNTNIIPTKIKRKQAINNSNKNNLMYSIEVLKKDINDYYGFEIEGQDRMFLLYDFTVVHNTVTFAQLEKLYEGNLLILSHREELVNQPRKYFSSPFGIEQAKNKSNGEKIISSCVQSMVKRLDKFDKNHFEVIIVDEAHHVAATTYKTILEYFTPRYIFGFTATPNRGDRIKINDVFKKILFKKDLRSGIKENFLSDIECKRVNIGYSLKGIKRKKGDLDAKMLDEEVNIDSANEAIAEAYFKHAKGRTLIFGINVKHCENIAAKIPESVVVSAKTKNRNEIIERFTKGEINCLINCMIFTEGTDIPLIETIIIARPTENESLYTQMVGRGLRKHPDKENLLLIDCVGVSENLNLCSAPTLLGLNMNSVPVDRENLIEGDLFELEQKIELESDCLDTWINNIRIVNLWAKENNYNTFGVNYFRLPDGSLKLSIPGFKKIIPKPDELGKIGKYDYQDCLEMMYSYLLKNHMDSICLWDINRVKKWKYEPATPAQLKHIHSRLPEMKNKQINKLDAAQILSRIFA